MLLTALRVEEMLTPGVARLPTNEDRRRRFRNAHRPAENQQALHGSLLTSRSRGPEHQRESRGGQRSGDRAWGREGGCPDAPPESAGSRLLMGRHRPAG